jgi:hypothetical protein
MGLTDENQEAVDLAWSRFSSWMGRFLGSAWAIPPTSCAVWLCVESGPMNKMFRFRMLYPNHTNGLGCTVLWIWSSFLLFMDNIYRSVASLFSVDGCILWNSRRCLLAASNEKATNCWT